MNAQSPVYPVPSGATCPGISTRDWLAAVALQALVTKGLEINADRAMTLEEKDDEFAVCAYRLADAMLRTRNAPLTETATSAH